MLIFITFVLFYTEVHECLYVYVISNSRGEQPLLSGWVVLFHISQFLADLHVSSPEHALIVRLESVLQRNQ